MELSPTVAGISDASRPRSILVVDDEAPILDLIADLLTDEGYSVLKAVHGLAALDVVRQQPVGLIISDVMMPFLDGVGLCEAVAQLPAEQAAPVILITAGKHPTSSCPVAILTKPFDAEALLVQVKLHLKA